MYRRLLILDLNPFHFPLPAIVSILHRLSGIFLVFLIPILLWGLEASLKSEQSFELLKVYLSSPLLRVFLWFLLLSLGFHWIAGLRHILMDLHFGESKRGGKVGAIVVLSLALILAFLLGGMLWNT